MNGTDGAKSRWQAIGLAARIWASRWVLAIGALTVLVVTWLASEPAWGAIAVFFVFFAAIAVNPADRMRQFGGGASASAPALQDVPAFHLAAAIPDPIVLFDQGGAVIHANAAATEAFGPLRPGSPVRLIFRTPEMQQLISHALEKGAGGEDADFIERVPLERQFRVTAAAIGEPHGPFILFFKDQSEVRRIDRMRADFIANASHELRTPLASISGFIETLRGPARGDAKARAHFLDIMQGQTARMARLVDDLLSLSHLEMKTFSRPGRTVDIPVLLESVLDALKPLAGELDVEIEKEIDAAQLTVRADKDELFQVFVNLVENACKYGQSGKRVIVSATREQKDVVVAVRDFGPGIPKEHIPRITERFYRVDIANSRANRGTGLGLAIVKHILTRHNARLEIWSEPGEGARFSVHFTPD